MFNRRHSPPQPAEAGATQAALDTSDLKEAYRLGRKDERRSRKRHPVLMTILFLLALAGAAFLVLAALNGSFQRAGLVADHNLSVAADQAEPAVRDAAGDAAQSLRTVGDRADETAPPAGGQPAR